MTIAKLYDFPLLSDERGSLIVMDKHSGVPFAAKRVYYLFGTAEGASRGFHAHKKLHQIAVCVSGRCRMVLDDGAVREDVWLDSPTLGVDLPPMLWHEMYDFTPDCLLLVMASQDYDEKDYIRNYETFKFITNSGG